MYKGAASSPRPVLVLLLTFLLAPDLTAEPIIIRCDTLAGNVQEAVHDPLTLSSRGDLTVQNTTFDLSYGPGLVGNVAAQTAFQSAAARWSAILRDPVSVNLTVDFQPLGPGVLGQSSSTYYDGGYNTVRNLVANGGEGKPLELALLPNIPTWNQLSVYLPNGFSLDGFALLTSANYKALGGSHSDSDGSITFSSDFSWDYDPSDGITAGTYDFEGVAVHEMGHNLGFVSEVDYVDYRLGEGGRRNDVEPRPLDFFRFMTADLGAGFDFTTTPRNLAPDGSHSFYYLDDAPLMSTGAYTGDGYQASHWKDNLALGIMDPTAGAGELLLIRQNDLTALDLIGWDVVPEPTTLSLLLTGLALLSTRRLHLRTLHNSTTAPHTSPSSSSP